MRQGDCAATRQRQQAAVNGEIEEDERPRSMKVAAGYAQNIDND